MIKQSVENPVAQQDSSVQGLDMPIFPKRRRPAPIQSIENLEIRNLLSGIMSAELPPAVPESEPNETLDQATDLGTSTASAVDGTIDRDGVDVDWYSFTLLVSSEVTLSASSGTLSLYNSASRDLNDWLNPAGNRMLAQASASDVSGAQITRNLAAGTYYVAVSGKGNAYFNPYLADSGLPGETGDYTLGFSATALSGPVGGDPVPLNVDIAATVVRVDFAGALNFTPAVELLDAEGNGVPLAWTNVNSAISELQFAPGQALAAGNYTAVLRDATGTVRITLQLRVLETPGSIPADRGDDTPATAIDLGELDQLGFVQIPGVIGDDAYYDFSSLDPAQRPGNDVDLYRFHISSTSPIGLQAEVFAGRIGSPLDAGISLYRFDSVTGQLQFVAGNNQSFNSTRSTNGAMPLFSDPLISAALEAGNYYLAVSTGLNTPSPTENQLAGSSGGIFNPQQSHSGSTGVSVGPYVLNVRVVEILTPPEVSSVSIADQSSLPTPPNQFEVQFSQFIDFSRLAAGSNVIPGISITDGKGHTYFPRLISFDVTTFTARFLIGNRLPAGSYQLRLDGNQGLTNIAGTPLVGNSDGIYISRFTISGPAAGTGGDPTVWTHDPQTDTAGSTQPLGVLFPEELASGVKIVRTAGTGSNRINDQSDEYSFEVLQTNRYSISISGARLPAGINFQVLDSEGNIVGSAVSDNGLFAIAWLKAGTYVLRVAGWSPTDARNVGYQMKISAIGVPDNPPPLFAGPGPAVGIRLITAVDPGGPLGSGNGSGSGSSGGSGSNGGLGSGGSSSGGFPGNGSGGGIPNLGTSPVSTRLIDLPNDYSRNRSGVPRLNTSSELENLVIAIPTITSETGTVSGARLQVSRTLRRISGLRDGLVPGRLSEFADGPLGKSHRAASGVSSNLSTVKDLSRLIDSALVTQRDSIRSEHAQSSDTPAPRSTTTVTYEPDPNPTERDQLNPGPAPLEGQPEQAGSEHTTRTSPKPSELSPIIRAVSRVAHVHDFEFQTSNDSVFIPTDMETAQLEGAYLPDTVFAAGMGLLVAKAAMQQRRKKENAQEGELYFTSVKGFFTPPPKKRVK